VRRQYRATVVSCLCTVFRLDQARSFAGSNGGDVANIRRSYSRWAEVCVGQWKNELLELYLKDDTL
jgi:hypothetical protein